jgi:hypothetical protein
MDYFVVCYTEPIAAFMLWALNSVPAGLMAKVFLNGFVPYTIKTGSDFLACRAHYYSRAVALAMSIPQLGARGKAPEPVGGPR